MKPGIFSFIGGEVSRLTIGEQPHPNSSSTTLENFNVNVHGGITRRRGTELVVSDTSKMCLMVPVGPDIIGFKCAGYQELVLPDFDFAVIRYMWEETGGTDLDTRTAITNSGIGSLDGYDVGWGRSDYTYGNVLYWAGDNTSGHDGEAILFDVDALEALSPAPNVIAVRCRAFWYNIRASGNFILSFTTYKGGAMSIVGTDWVNTGGVQVSHIELAANAVTNNPNNEDGDDIATLFFNRATRTGTIVPA